ncbi:phasin family protein [Piscinibacter sp.]|uniref:phasin family protein n=1 Tax=Piscinibacter sp. TaxID=1903157 RepID=UPI002BEF70A0|nr:phasin family protein [Albitalea sp.]HUG23958.1 phasin family protein [Albitalea sp.]
MASKSDTPAAKKARSRTARKTAAPAAPVLPAKQAGGAKSLLRAGLKALNEVRDDVITRQSRVFEALLGIDTSQTVNDRAARERKLLGAGEDAAGIQKFEEIFDQRVARSLERLGMPSPQALAALCRQLEAINEHLKRIEPAAPKRAPRRRPTRD